MNDVESSGDYNQYDEQNMTQADIEASLSSLDKKMSLMEHKVTNMEWQQQVNTHDIERMVDSIAKQINGNPNSFLPTVMKQIEVIQPLKTKL